MAEEQGAQEVELLTPSTAVNAASYGAQYGNVWRKKLAWETRPGFGQMAQFDTLAMSPNDGLEPFGYRKVLGSYTFRTNYGHVQIVTVLLARVFVASTSGEGNFQDSYCVSVFDVTSNERHEEILYVQTSASVLLSEQMQYATPFYNENPVLNSKTVLQAVDENVSFAEYRDSIVFCAPNMGVWCYTPCDFGGVPKQVQLDVVRGGGLAAAAPLGDSSRIAPVIATPGLFAQSGYGYLTIFPAMTAVAVLGGFVVYASGRTVYFAEPGKPGSVQATNAFTVPCQNEIVNIAQNNGYLYIFTQNETWAFQPGNDQPIPGRLTQLTDSIGCLNPSAATRRESTLVWASMRGIHILTGPLSIDTISDPVRPLFDEQVSLPLSQFYQNAGVDALTEQQPRMAYNWREIAGVSLTYDNLTRTLFVCVPQQNYMLCLQDDSQNQSWFFWTFDSVVNPIGTKVGVKQEIRNPQLMALDGEVFCVSGLDEYVPSQQFPEGNGPSFSYIVSQMGRGGAIDRTVVKQEDNRNIQGNFEQVKFGNDESYLLIDRPIVAPVGYVMPSGRQLLDQTVLYPIRVYTAQGTPIQRITLYMQDISPYWYPVTNGFQFDSQIIDFIVGPERYPSRYGYQDDDGTNHVLWTPSLRQVTISFDSARVVDAFKKWSTWPDVNIAQRDEEPLMYIGFQFHGPEGTTTPGLFTPSTTFTAKINGDDVSLQVYQHTDLREQEDADSRAQFVDWWAKSEQVGAKSAVQLATRGVFAKVLTRGRGENVFATTFTRGLLNAIAASDWKDWGAQIEDIVDASGTTSDVSMFKKNVNNPGEALQQTGQPIRSRLGTEDGPRRVLYDYLSEWASTDDAAAGNTLTADESYDTLAFSTKTRGEHVSWLLFGHVGNRAAKLTLDSAKAVFRAVGGRRRYGR